MFACSCCSCIKRPCRCASVDWREDENMTLCWGLRFTTSFIHSFSSVCSCTNKMTVTDRNVNVYKNSHCCIVVRLLFRSTYNQTRFSEGRILDGSDFRLLLLFLPRDAMLARYMLSSSIRLSVSWRSQYFWLGGGPVDHWIIFIRDMSHKSVGAYCLHHGSSY